MNDNLQGQSKVQREAKGAIINAYNYSLEQRRLDEVRTILGLTWRTYNSCLEAVEDGEKYKHISRKKRERSELSKVQEKSILAFCHSEESSAIDSNSKRVVKVLVDGEEENHVARVWNALTLDEKYSLYKESSVVEDYINANGNAFRLPSRSFFYKYTCACLTNPTMQSCVDIIVSGMHHYMKAISKFIRQNPQIKQQLMNESWYSLLTAHPETFIESCCCAKVPHPHLECGAGSSKRIPKFIPWDCIYGRCNNCGINKKHKLDQCDVIKSNSTNINLLEWKDVPRQGKKKNGEPNTQLELSHTMLPVNEVFEKMINHFEVCRQHVGEKEWKSHVKKIDSIMSHPDKTRVICTDFGATLDLRAKETDNSSVDNHAVVCIFFVLTEWRTVEFLNTKTNTTDETIVNNCDKWIVFGDTLSRGKKNDHVFHNACLAHLISFYDSERSAADKQPIPNNIIHTDNCPTQYKCRQNFYHVATFGDNHQTRIVHKFAQKYGFKGPWDATGKLIKGKIHNNEMKYHRCANAFDCYIKLQSDLGKDGTEINNQKWLAWEADGDERILNKTPFKTNRTFVGLGTEYKDEYDNLTAQGYKHIIYTNRNDIPDMKAVPQTLKLFQIEGQKTPDANGKYKLRTTCLPCSCPNCRDHKPFQECLYKEIRNSREVTVSKGGENENADNDEFGLRELTVADLKNELRQRFLPLSGRKEELLERLTAALRDEAAQDDDIVDDGVIIDEEEAEI